MPLDPVSGKLIGTAIGGIAGLFGASKDYERQKELIDQQNQFNLDLAREQQQWQEDMWHMSNEYNTPSAQINRLNQAGLNPSLMYGQGQAATGNAKAPPAGYQRANATAMRGVNMFSDSIRNAGAVAQTMNMQAQTQLVEEKATTEKLNQILKTIAGGKGNIELNTLKGIQDSLVDDWLLDHENKKLRNEGQGLINKFNDQTFQDRVDKVAEELKGLGKLNEIRAEELALKKLERGKEEFYKALYDNPELLDAVTKLSKKAGSRLGQLLDSSTLNEVFGLFDILTGNTKIPFLQ